MRPEEPSSPPEAEDASAPEASRLDHWLRPFVEDSALWPVTLVGIASLRVFGAAVVLLAVLERNGFAVAALLALVWMSADGVWRGVRRGRLGILGRLVLGLWLLIGLVALAATWSGIF